MSIELGPLLIAYPLGVFTNLSTKQVEKLLQKTEIAPLKKLFMKAFYETLKFRKKQVDSYGKRIIQTIEKKTRKNERLLFEILSNNSVREFDFSHFKSEGFRKKVAIDICNNFSFDLNKNLTLIQNLISESLENYEFCLISHMSEKEGIQALIYRSQKTDDLYSMLSSLVDSILTKEDLKELKLFIQNQFQLQSEKKEDERSFSDQLIQNMNEINRQINALTKDQYLVLNWMKRERRATVSGCAGSGKTLVAIELGFRHNRAGLDVLILCHNPYLSRFINQLTQTTTIEVACFSDWISQINKKPHRKNDSWTHFSEPTEKEINSAFDFVNSKTKQQKYDSIIIDEGQDFRDTWFLIAEASLKNPEDSFFYIFHDDNQSLLPFRSKYPIANSPYSLSKNCRNAGKIFSVISKFHPQAPEASFFLKDKGDFKLNIFRDRNAANKIQRVLQLTLESIPSDRIVVLTGEVGSLHDSILNGIEVDERQKISWQEAVLHYMHSVCVENLKPSLSNLISNNPTPTKDDVKLVCTVASNATYWNFDCKCLPALSKDKLKKIRVHWVNDGLKYRLKVSGREILNPIGTMAKAYVVNFFQNENWANALPRYYTYKLLPPGEQNISDNCQTIPFYRISSYKGLEKDCIILFIPTKRSDLKSILYVGISRAKILLQIVINENLMPQLSNYLL